MAALRASRFRELLANRRQISAVVALVTILMMIIDIVCSALSECDGQCRAPCLRASGPVGQQLRNGDEYGT